MGTGGAVSLFFVMAGRRPGHPRLCLWRCRQDVDARDTRGHDAGMGPGVRAAARFGCACLRAPDALRHVMTRRWSGALAPAARGARCAWRGPSWPRICSATRASRMFPTCDHQYGNREHPIFGVSRCVRGTGARGDARTAAGPDLPSSWPGFVPAIHVFLAADAAKTWMPATSAGMTRGWGRACAPPRVSDALACVPRMRCGM